MIVHKRAEQEAHSNEETFHSKSDMSTLSPQTSSPTNVDSGSTRPHTRLCSPPAVFRPFPRISALSPHLLGPLPRPDSYILYTSFTSLHLYYTFTTPLPSLPSLHPAPITHCYDCHTRTTKT